jgi:hypothetical protein
MSGRSGARRATALINVAAANHSQLNSMPAQGSNYQFINGKARKVYKSSQKAGSYYRLTPSGARAYLKNHEKKALLNHLLKHSVAPPAVIVNNSPNKAAAVPLGANIKSNNKVAGPNLSALLAIATQKNNKGNYYLNAKKRKVYKGAKAGALFRFRNSGAKAYLTSAEKKALVNHLLKHSVNTSTPPFVPAPPPSSSLSSILGSSIRNNNKRAQAAHTIVAQAINKAKLGNNRNLLNNMPMGPVLHISHSVPARFGRKPEWNSGF